MADHAHDHGSHGHDHGSAHDQSGHDQSGHDYSAHDHGGHDHSGHSHGLGGHSHAPKDFGRAFAVAVVLNILIVLLQGGYGYWSNSVALISDAGHNLSDVLGLLIAWLASVLSRRPPTSRFTYGLRGSSILAALFNAGFLLVAVGGLSWEAIRRLAAPEATSGGTVMVVAAIGLVLNAATAWLFASGRHGDANIRGAFLHIAADAGVSAGVVVAGLIILLTGWAWVDPVVSLLVNLVIVVGTWGLLRDSAFMSLGAVPRGIEPDRVRGYLAQQEGVARLHDLHIWPMSTTETALTVHLVTPGGHPGDPFLAQICAGLRERFGIGHATIQVEISEAGCELAPDLVV